MQKMTLKLKNRLYINNEHPYKTYEKTILQYLPPRAIVLDAGCGRKAPVISKIAEGCRTAVGVDIARFDQAEVSAGVQLVVATIVNLMGRDYSFDMVISRSVLEHIPQPLNFFREANRILKKGGTFIFLTPNLYDYGSIISKLVPNRFHAAIVKMTEGRNENDTFPTYYRANTERDIRKLASESGFTVLQINYLGQYPSYLMFNPLLFMVGAGYDKLLCRFNVFSFLRGWVLGVLREE